jgi:8-oxo-dGTP pyrophosphatase MutT (NUDIX family)
MASETCTKDLTWTVEDSRLDRRYGLFSVTVNKSRSPRTGKIHEFQVLNSPDWVAVLALTPNREMVMVRQFRHGTGEMSLEPPGGLVKEGETAEQSGREELEEETGYLAPTLELLGWMHPMPAIFDNRFYVYLARNATPTGREHPDETEEIETVLVPVGEIREYIRSGKITCSVMIAALHLFFDHEEQQAEKA